jgi:hypothetical protein
LGEAVDYVKTDLMPDFDFDAFNHEYPEPVSEEVSMSAAVDGVDGVASDIIKPAAVNHTSEDVDKW